ncbi:hypothetical protein Taro_023690 [Colocasia esculenta]|uniref:Uncharacterized protein n=1 Tax=Colocasia esculenta TaxID=4460 RepID=A0A843V5C3_COLES|nr:hypothetical protein [Colocasia esculenta]
MPVGPFVRDCETERLFLCCVVRRALVVVSPVVVCHGVGTVVVVVGERLSGVEVELCSVGVVCLGDQLLSWCACELDLSSVTRALVVVSLVVVCHGVGTVVVVVGVEVELCSVGVVCLGDQLLSWCACEVCGLGFTVIEWINDDVVSSSF